MANISSSKKYHRLITIKDRSFSIPAIAKHHLSICISNTSFKVSCINPTTTQCLFLEAYSLSTDTPQQQIQAIEQLYQEHPLLGMKDWSTITLCIGSQQYSLIPKVFVQEGNVTDYLKFTCPVGSNTVQYFTHAALNLSVAFAVEPLLLNWFQKTYHQIPINIIHQASSLIEAALTYVRGNSSSSLSQLLVFVEESHLHIIITQKDKLLYYNRFEYTQIDEFLYYILSVMKTLQLDPQFHEVILAGSIYKNSLAYQKAHSYIRKLFFIEKPPYLKCKRSFGRGILVRYLDVLSAHLCR